MTSSDLPSTRSQWASLDWKEAQLAVANLLNQHGFMIFEEKRLNQNKRTDVYVIKETMDRITFGIIEVKCYQKISRNLEKSAMRQALKYLKHQYHQIENNHRYVKKRKQYFAAVIYTRDYPASFYHHRPHKYKRIIPKALLDKQNLYLISSTPNSFLQKLENILPVENKQAKIDDFF